MLTAVVLAAAGAILNIIGPDKLADVTDLITEGLMTGIDVEAVVDICVLLASLYVCGWAFSLIQGQIMAAVTQRVSKTLRTDISDKINRLPLRYFDTNSIGNTLSRVTNDVDTISQTMNQRMEEPVHVRIDAALDGVCRQFRICGCLYCGSAACSERT